MSQIKQSSKAAILEKVQKILNQNPACYVLITCTPPSKDGQMEVEMAYEGDDDLAAFLVDNASQVFDERMARSKSK